MDDNSQNDKKKKIKIRTSAVVKKKVDVKWVVKITIFTFLSSVFFSFSTSKVMESINLFSAFAILFSFILINIISDIIGMSVATANETPFHSLAARKVRATKEAVYLVRNAEKVSNFCSDVIGDISGIISGTTGAIIIEHISLKGFNINLMLISLIIVGLIAALTVGGKAIGKAIAISRCNSIVYFVALIIYFIKRLNPFLNREKEEDKK